MKDISAALKADMERKGVNLPLSLEILRRVNSIAYGEATPLGIKGLPDTASQRILAFDDLAAQSGHAVLQLGLDEASARLSDFGLALPASVARTESLGSGRQALFTIQDLRSLGKALLPFTAYGVLNGGSATSYADEKKNLSLGKAVFEVVHKDFARLAPTCKGLPKGCSPAFINPDGSPGPSFLELKMRYRLLAARSAPRYRLERDFLPLYQMTSDSTHLLLDEHYRSVSASEFIAPLAESLDLEPATWKSGIQPLICAFTHSSEGLPRRIFDKAYGKADTCLPLPGGHGQSFMVLADIFTSLRKAGVRYAFLGNVDNLGYTVDPAELAVMALQGSPAGFEFSRRSPLDLKGGVLVEREDSSWTVADIGPAIAFEELLVMERKGIPALFNCATAIFDLDYLVPRLERIARDLPLRISDQDKDAGAYSQAEQVTWEVMGLLPDFSVFVVEKKRRFLAAKLLIDTILTSGIGLDDPRLPDDIRATAGSLNKGLETLLSEVYGLKLVQGRWLPREA